MPTDPLDITRAEFHVRHREDGTAYLVLTDGTHEVFLTSTPPLGSRDLSFTVGRLERQLQVLGGKLRG